MESDIIITVPSGIKVSLSGVYGSIIGGNIIKWRRIVQIESIIEKIKKR